MISIESKRVAALIDVYKTVIDRHWVGMKVRLEDLLANSQQNWRRRYVELLLEKGRSLITASPSDLFSIQDEFDAIVPINPSNRQHRKFKDKVLYALGYSARRGDFYPEYFRKLGIKSCVYCNSQLCVTVERQNKELQAKFQVDHFISKNKYPCLSVALFNLYPVCASCNNIKSTKSVSFKLYTDASSPCEFKFVLKDADKLLATYLTNRDPSTIKIDFEEPAVVGDAKLMNDVFSIKGIYETQIDIVEELILKRHIYNEGYLEELRELFKDNLPDDKFLLRLVVGAYTEEAEMHNRPMSKFIQDIAVQLKLL